ncbi:putative LRR receptor-like serine/threonine-protein kinase [Forsythia ovata]|uniref:non-specific serine/threonine protein kinase n=1 Tax=Forsythia ovata TaxID=205694 RepID=A0ABD1RNK4_9LAMI
MVMERAYTFPLVILLACCVTACMANNMNISTDESALLAFKSRMMSTTDPSKILIKNWSASTPVCVWIGVTCGLRHQRVTTLDISSMNLSGNIPSQLGNLSFLVSINLSKNFFYGSLPQELIRLRRLQIIDFGVNSFSGQIPSWFGFLHKLQVLYLRNNSFTGFIPPSLSNISTLQNLDLSFNPLQGKIPKEFGNLHNLKRLILQYNRLTGLIPLTIFNISIVEHLAFTGNYLSGNLPVDICHGIPRLKGLYLSFNELDGEIPANLSECSQLQLISLSGNKYSGSIPSEIGRLRTLKILYLGSNDLSGAIPPELGNLENLVELRIGENFFTGSIPASIFNISLLQCINIARNNLSGNLDLLDLGYKLPNLEELYLNGNNFHGRIPNFIANASKLTTISLADNNFTGPIPNFFGDLRFLEYVYLGDNNFISESPELSFFTSFTNCRYLIKLAFSDNPLNGILPVSVGNLSTSLQYLYAYNCDLWGSIPKEIGNLSSLIVLSLYDNQLTGSIPASVGDLQKLQGLGLGQNKISGSIPGTLCELQNLNTLFLSQNLITGAIPDCIGNITTLRFLYIQTNRLTSSIPATLWLQNYVLELNLSSNFLSGSLPQEIGNMKVATHIDLSVNRFSGSIPSTIGYLQSLTNLSLAHNTLQGSIPESMGKLLSIERLDLSYNNLSGNIPKSFEALRYLTYFDVSFNDLSGEVPSGGPFKNFSSQSFLSNEGLCGDPIYGLPPCHSTGPKRRKLMLRVVFSLLGIIVLITIAMALAYAVGRYRRKNLVENTTDFAPGTTLRVSYYELMQATQGYSESHLLGSGSFGSVYRGTLNDGSDVAVKVFDLQHQNAFKSFDVECEVLRNLRHRNLCKVISTCSNQDFKALVLEYMSNGSLEKWLYSEGCLLDILQRINIMIDVACALEYLHYGYSTYIVHCDLKPSNVLLDEDMVAHLSDFGIAKLLGEGESNAHTTTMGTLGYIAPEYGLEGSVSIRCDVYSYGIMLMEVFTRMKPSSEIFSGELSLRSWINDSMPNAITRIIDSNLLGPEEEEDYTKKLKCLSSIMELALNCSMESANERVNMKDVVVALKKIRFQLLT